MRRVCSLAVIGSLLLAGSAFAAKKGAFTVAPSAVVNAEIASEVIVPISIAYDADLTALDIPLKYSEGVTLIEVTFGDMLDGYDFKSANIKADQNVVIIGAINMIYGSKPGLEAGEGVVANLRFRIDDESLKSFTIEKTRLENPDHDLYFVYNVYDENNIPSVVMHTAEFAPVEVALSGGAGAKVLPTEFALRQNYPNPFNPSTKIQYDLPFASKVSVTIYNVLGQSVVTLVDGPQEAGVHVQEWNGRDSEGSQVSSGVYFYKINAADGQFVQTRKMMMLK